MYILAYKYFDYLFTVCVQMKHRVELNYDKHARFILKLHCRS